MNKREFVMGSCAALATGTATSDVVVPPMPVSGAKAPGLRRQRLPDLATDQSLRAWQAYVGHEFLAADGSVLKLNSVQTLASDPVLEQFSLQFSTDAARHGGTQVLSHHTGQRVHLYLDAVKSASGAGYSAHFSRLG